MWYIKTLEGYEYRYVDRLGIDIEKHRVDIDDRCGRHGGGSEGSHRGKNFSKTWYLWVTRRKIFIDGAFWALFRQNSDIQNTSAQTQNIPYLIKVISYTNHRKTHTFQIPK